MKLYNVGVYGKIKKFFRKILKSSTKFKWEIRKISKISLKI